MARTVVLLGPPGAGKGTQAVGLAAGSGLRHVSTGDLLRRAIADGTPLGRRVQPIMEMGGLVEDGIVAELVGECLDQAPGGLLLDGYPRTLGQAAHLERLLAERGLPQPLVIEICVHADEVVRRLSGRKTCLSCGPRPPGEARCGSCQGELLARPDDDERVVRERMRVYATQTAPLVEHYGRLGILRPVDGADSPAGVGRRIREVVEAG